MEQAKILYNDAPRTVNSLVLCHNTVQRDLDCQLELISATAPRPDAKAMLWLSPQISHSKSLSGRETHGNLEGVAS